MGISKMKAFNTSFARRVSFYGDGVLREKGGREQVWTLATLDQHLSCHITAIERE
jgi:hypothetical protein